MINSLLLPILDNIAISIAVIALFVSLSGLYITVQRYMQDKPNIELKVISSEHISEKNTKRDTLIVYLQISNKGYVGTTITYKHFLINNNKYDVYLVDDLGNRADKYIFLPAHGAKLLALEAELPIPTQDIIRGDLVIKHVYGEKRINLCSKKYMLDKIIDISSEGYISEFNGLKFKADRIFYSKDYERGGLLVDIERLDGTIIQTSLHLGMEQTIGDIEIRLLNANEISLVTSGKLAIKQSFKEII